MAMRENTGLQVALILFVMITVVLAVTTYMYFDASNKADKERQIAEDKATSLKAGLDEKIKEVETLRKLLGYEDMNSPKVDEIVTNFHADMAKFGEGYNAKRDYVALPQYLSKTIDELNDQLSAEKLRVKQMDAELAAARAQEQKNVAVRDANYTEAVADYNSQKTTIDNQRKELVARVDGIQQAFDKASREVSTIKADKDKEIDALSQRVGKLDLLRKTLTDKIDAIQNPTAVGKAERPDGRVTWVSQRGGTVYINLGSDDGLRRSTMFTVYDAGAVNLAQTDAKASIEVTTIRGPHLAEARIIEDSLSNPILSQDNIYSPVWDPGQKTHFALAGFMDIDGDRKSDRQLIRSLIAKNGGAIDAEVLDDGSREGRLTINTRYLVVGETPTEKTKSDLRTAYSTMIKEAGDLGIERITVERLLSDMGWRGNERTVGAGTDPTGGTFKAVPKDDPRVNNGGFQQRTRPGGSTRRSSAY